MPADSYFQDIEKYRADYRKVLGLDKLPTDGLPESAMTRIGEDEDAVIYRVTVHITPEIPTFGLLFVPHNATHAPLVIAQHGGGGTPELCSDINGKNNYAGMVRRTIRHGAVVYAPQLLIWNYKEDSDTAPAHPIPYERSKIDGMLKGFGYTVTGLEVRGIMNAITYLSKLPYVNEDQIGMLGLSYGGYFTLHTMAADTRIRAGYSNACFNDRTAHFRLDWGYSDATERFNDAQVAALCAPRALYISIGETDPVFSYKSALPEVERARAYFRAAGCEDRFAFELWEGGHTLPPHDEGFEFLFSALHS